MMRIRLYPLLVVLTAAFLPLAAVALAGVASTVDIPKLTRDVASIAGVHPLSGALSTLGLLVLAGSAWLWLFAVLLLPTHARRDDVPFALATGLALCLLTVDDAFQLHEGLAPTYLGIPESMTVGALAALGATYIAVFRHRVLGAEAWPFALAGMLFAASVFLDAVLEPRFWPDGNWVYLVEDGLKWAGIVCVGAASVSWCGERLVGPGRPAEVRSPGELSSVYPDARAGE